MPKLLSNGWALKKTKNEISNVAVLTAGGESHAVP
jgi:hypothetical protein